MSDALASHSRRALVWLAIGALAGIGLAAATLVHAPGTVSPALGSGVVALVNGQPIQREALARYAATVARERGHLELDAAQESRILDRLIDEELLLQRGLALGIERNEPSARRAIVSAVIDGITSADAREPDRAALEAFYRENGARWTRPGDVLVEMAWVPKDAPDAEARAAEMVRRAGAGESLDVINAELGAPIEPPLPKDRVSPEVLRDRVGDVVVQALLALPPGETSEPVRAFDGLWVVRLLARDPDVQPPLDAVYEPVRQAWLEREHEERLVRELAVLREQATIERGDMPGTAAP
jgi:hypothetical protein